MPKKKRPEIKAGVIYARYSSHAQKDASIEQQVDECMKYARENGIKIIETYADRAVSGRTDRRADFQRMMKDAEKHRFDCVIAWKSNRMGRNMLQAMTNEAKLHELGIHVRYTEEEFDDSAAGRFALRSMMNVNQFYSENMAEDVRRGMMDNASNCMVTNGQLPFGYARDENLRYIIDPPKAAIVQEIFSRIACGDAYVDIANDLNARGIKTSRGNPWGRSSFHALITNERYTGVYIYDDLRVEGGIPQIVDKGLFYRVQEVLKTRAQKGPRSRHRATGDYLLTGKLYCGECKGPMVGTSGTGKNGTLHYYYTCKNRHAKHTCKRKNIRRDDIEYAVALAIKQYIMSDDVLEWIADGAMNFAKKCKEETPIGMLEGQLAENKRALKNLLAAIEQGIVTPTTKERLLELEREQATLTSRLADEQAALLSYSREDIVAAFRDYRQGDVDDKQFQESLFDIFLVAVYVYENDLKIVFNLAGRNVAQAPLTPEQMDTIEQATPPECSYMLASGVPQGTPDVLFFST